MYIQNVTPDRKCRCDRASNPQHPDHDSETVPNEPNWPSKPGRNLLFDKEVCNSQKVLPTGSVFTNHSQEYS